MTLFFPCNLLLQKFLNFSTKRFVLFILGNQMILLNKIEKIIKHKGLYILINSKVQMLYRNKKLYCIKD